MNSMILELIVGISEIILVIGIILYAMVRKDNDDNEGGK